MEKDSNCFNSTKYWTERYKSGGNSGVGSYGEIAEYKAKIVNKFLKENNLNSVLEMGCGDGNQLSLLDVEYYNGYDVSEKVIEDNKSRFPNYNFSTDLSIFPKSDLILSMDVILHLIEDSVYKDYIKTLFDKSNKYVVIFSPDIDKDFGNHCKYRNFTRDVPSNFKLIKKVENPLKGVNTQADFYIYEKI